jgi:hypothetical protein
MSPTRHPRNCWDGLSTKSNGKLLCGLPRARRQEETEEGRVKMVCLRNPFILFRQRVPRNVHWCGVLAHSGLHFLMK